MAAPTQFGSLLVFTEPLDATTAPAPDNLGSGQSLAILEYDHVIAMRPDFELPDTIRIDGYRAQGVLHFCAGCA